MPESQSKLARIAIDDDDILLEILVRLPAKSLLQLKSVCKLWRSLISSHHFSLLHTLRHPTATANSTAIILQRRSSKYCHVSLQPNNNSCKLTPLTLSGKIIQSCHGLLLCEYPYNAPAVYYIYNLATGLHRDLDIDHNAKVRGIALAFDPSKSPYYKVVCVKLADPSFRYQIEVFDSDSCSWTIVERNYRAPYDALFFGNGGVYWNNAIIWSRGWYGFGILPLFDISKGTIAQAPEIDCTELHFDTSHCVESGGHLHFIRSDRVKLSVFEMKRDFSKWSFKYSIRYADELLLRYNKDRVLGIMRAQNEEETFLLFYVKGKLIVYNRIDKNFQELTYLGVEMEELGENPFHIGCMTENKVYQFVETLVPV